MALFSAIFIWVLAESAFEPTPGYYPYQSRVEFVTLGSYGPVFGEDMSYFEYKNPYNGNEGYIT
jgi:hypothetical protein